MSIKSGIIGIVIGIFLGSLTNLINSDKEKIQQLQLKIMLLQDYKRAYLDHVEMCDTLHQKCFKIGN